MRPSASCAVLGADQTDRFVFDDYAWDRRGPAYSRFDRNRWIPTRIPLSAIISGAPPSRATARACADACCGGPIAGGPFADGDATPRAVSRRHWDRICPRPTKVDAVEVRRMHGGGATAVQIEETWLEVLGKIDDPCVEVVETSGFIFHVLRVPSPSPPGCGR